MTPERIGEIEAWLATHPRIAVFGETLWIGDVPAVMDDGTRLDALIRELLDALARFNTPGNAYYEALCMEFGREAADRIRDRATMLHVAQAASDRTP